MRRVDLWVRLGKGGGAWVGVGIVDEMMGGVGEWGEWGEFGMTYLVWRDLVLGDYPLYQYGREYEHVTEQEHEGYYSYPRGYEYEGDYWRHRYIDGHIMAGQIKRGTIPNTKRSVQYITSHIMSAGTELFDFDATSGTARADEPFDSPGDSPVVTPVLYSGGATSWSGYNVSVDALAESLGGVWEGILQDIEQWKGVTFDSSDDERVDASRNRGSTFVRVDDPSMSADARSVVEGLFGVDLFNEPDALQPCYDAVPGFKESVFQRKFVIAGPRLGGSPWHTDKFNSSFYNAVLSGGAKQWLLLPPSVSEPIGLGHGKYAQEHVAKFDKQYVAHDSFFNEVMQIDMSSWEYFRTWRDIAKFSYGEELVEVRVEAGDVLYVPPGWWHMTINADDNVAVSENFVEPRFREQAKSTIEDLLEVTEERWPPSMMFGEVRKVLKECLGLI